MRRDPRPVRAFPLTLVTNDWTLVVPPEAVTLEGFREWATRDDFPERVRVTFLQGEIILDASNQEINTHVAVKGEVYAVLATLVKQRRLGMFCGAGVPLTNVAAEVSNNPDGLFVSRDTLASGRVKLVPWEGSVHRSRELEGTPDWILEVISAGSVAKNKTRLRKSYHKAGIPEYWLIDARDHDKLIIQILLRRKNGYVAATPDRDGWQRSKVFDRAFRLDRLLDDHGLWDYTLHVREE